MAEAFELADQLHVEHAHTEHELTHAELLAQLDEACRRVAELEARIAEHEMAYHVPEPEPEPEPPPEPEPEEPDEPVIEVPEPPEVPDEPAPIVDVPPRAAHPYLRRFGSRE